MNFFPRKPKPGLMLCIYCGRPKTYWPRSFSQAFYDEHACPSGHGHAYSTDPHAAALIATKT